MKMFLITTAFVAVTTIGAIAQTTAPQTTTSPQSGTQMQPQGDSNFPYSSQATYNSVESGAVPQNITSSFGTEYNGITDAKWESNNDVYRSSFQRDGKQMSVIYDKNGKMRESRSAVNMTDFPSAVQSSLNGKTASSAYEVKVGNNTYYSAQIDGQDMYYDSKGKSVKMPGKPRK